ncbi:MAG: acetyl-CoA C-acetyltransferase [Anaerolineaceae bacterium]
MFEGSDESFLLSAVRTPMGKFQGSLATIPAPKLGAIVVKEAVERAGVKNKAEIDEVIMGNVVSAGLGQNPARQAAIFAGLPSSVGATTINKVCGSGLKSVMLAAQAIHAGDGSLYVAGGMESMSRAPFLVEGRNNELRFGHGRLIDALLNDGLWDPFENWAMGDSAEFIAKEYQVTREAMDEFALASQMKAIQAIDAGKFIAEIIPVEVPAGKGQTKLFDTDETPRRDTSQEILSKLKPSFQKDGRVTAGNAPGLNDGAAALVVASASKARSLNAEPLARIIGYAQVAVEPRYLFIAPAKVIPLLLDKVGWTMSDVDLIELNEAFAAQILADGYALKDFGWDWTKVNIYGGAIALGHPIGASGARVLTTLIYALKDRNLKRGLVSLCLGGAEAVAMAIEVI